MRYFLIMLGIMLFGFAEPGFGYGLPQDTSTNLCVPLAIKRFDEALQLMKKHYYKRDAVNWDSLSIVARQKIENAGNCDEALQAVDWCFRQLNERHSFIMPANRAAVYTSDSSMLLARPSLSKVMGEIRAEHLSDRGIGYISIPWISTSDPEICTIIADSIQNVIEQLDAQGLSKWIIDIRKNTGGNCWPMLAGIGPLLGEGTCGYFVTPAERLPLIYKDGAAPQGRFVRCQVSRKPYKTRVDKKWIIVLTGPRTSSSGEIVALAFKGKDNAFLYGEPTAGFTTANATYPLSDKSLLVLTVCNEADRFGNICDGKIMPDQLVSAATRYAFEDPVRAAAVMWLDMQ